MTSELGGNGTPGNLLCVSNFHSNAGYAWDFIEGLYAALADDLIDLGVRTWVAYPGIAEAPSSLLGSTAEPFECAFRLNHPAALAGAIRRLKELDIRVIYLSDRPCWHVAYTLFRLAGVRRIVVHDHTSGQRTPPTSLKRFIKGETRRVRSAMADEILAVSEYVRKRKIEVDLMPVERVRTMFNSVDVPETVDRARLRALFAIPADRPVIVCACRAADYKGVQHLLRAFEVVSQRVPNRPILIHFGDGPYMPDLMAIRDGMEMRDDVVLAGYRPGVADLLGGADLAVIPSVWGEAFGLGALEPAARGVAVVATRVGGIPEVVEDGVTGLLVPPADPEALAEAITTLLVDPARRQSMGIRGRERAAGMFSRTSQVEQLRSLFRAQFAMASSGTTGSHL